MCHASVTGSSTRGEIAHILAEMYFHNMCVVSRHLSETTFIALIVTDEPSSFWPFSDLFFKETNHAWFSSSGTQLKLCGKKESSSDCLSYQQQMRAVAKFEKSGEEAKTSHGTTAVSTTSMEIFPSSALRDDYHAYSWGWRVREFVSLHFLPQWHFANHKSWLD